MKFLDPIKRRVHLMISRAVVSALADGAGRQYVQVSALKGETKDNVERIQQYGFTSNPLSGAQAVMLCVGGNRAHPIVTNVDDPRYRPTDSEAGESGVYHFEGHRIRLMAGGIVQIECDQVIVKASDKVRFETPIFDVTGEIKDRCDTDGQSMADMRDVYNSHTHPENDSGGPTDAPNQNMGV